MSSQRRVVVTGLGVVAPNGHGIAEYESALRAGRSGLRFEPKMRELRFGCQVAGVPQGIDKIEGDYFTADDLFGMNSNMRYANIAAIDAWRDAGLPPPDEHERDCDTGAVIGTGLGGPDTFGGVVPRIDSGNARRIGSSIVEQIMGSSVSAKLAGLLGLGNQVTSNSSACSTGTEALILALERIRSGKARRMLAGGSEGSSHYIWAAFDAMRVLDRNHNEEPERASRPLSRTAGGFVPGSGAGVLMLESLDSARHRGARIYAELLGAAVNCGGHRRGGSMTAPNPEAVQSCIRAAVLDAGITPGEIDAINGHLTGTFADPFEVQNWSKALERGPDRFPLINSTKSLIGHALGGAGALEAVAVVLELARGFVHGSANCEDLHPEIEPFARSIPHETIEPARLDVVAKASFGFGDVNACVVIRRWSQKNEA